MNVLSPSPTDYFSCDEAGPYQIEFLDGTARNVYLLICVCVVTRKVYAIPMQQQSISALIKSLEMLLFRHGRVSIILDAHKSRISLGNRPRAAELAPEYNLHPKTPTLFNILHDSKENLLAKRGIGIKK